MNIWTPFTTSKYFNPATMIPEDTKTPVPRTNEDAKEHGCVGGAISAKHRAAIAATQRKRGQIRRAESKAKVDELRPRITALMNLCREKVGEPYFESGMHRTREVTVSRRATMRSLRIYFELTPQQIDMAVDVGKKLAHFGYTHISMGENLEDLIRAETAKILNEARRLGI